MVSGPMESVEESEGALQTGESIVHVFDRVVRVSPHKPAIITSHRSWTFGDIQSWSNKVARSVFASPRDKPIALLIREPRYLIASMYGVMRAGGFFVVVDPDYPLERIESIVDRSDARTIIASDTAAESVRSLVSSDLALLRISDIEPLDDSLVE